MEKLFRILEKYGALDHFKNKTDYMVKRRNEMFEELRKLYDK